MAGMIDAPIRVPPAHNRYRKIGCEWRTTRDVRFRYVQAAKNIACKIIKPHMTRADVRNPIDKKFSSTASSGMSEGTLRVPSLKMSGFEIFQTPFCKGWDRQLRPVVPLKSVSKNARKWLSPSKYKEPPSDDVCCSSSCCRCCTALHAANPRAMIPSYPLRSPGLRDLKKKAVGCTTSGKSDRT
eukprot:scaffold6829_cov171-Amphora_coffeaeformis.AAC.26